MQFGYALTTARGRNEGDFACLIDELIAEARAAEAAGFEVVQISEGHQHPVGHFGTPLLLAAVVAAQTRRIQILIGTLLLPLHHPLHVAEEAAAADIVSRGRLILGVANGYLPGQFAMFGVSPRERASRVEEGIALLRRAWSGERFTFAGRHYQIENGLVTPPPVQPGGPPIWLGGSVDASVRRAGRIADGWLADFLRPLPAIARWARLYREAAASAGRPATVGLLRDAWLADSREQALAELGPWTLPTYRLLIKLGALNAQTDPWLAGLSDPQALALDQVAADRVILGSADDCRREIARWQAEAGVDLLVVRLRHGLGPGHQGALAAIERFGREVIAPGIGEF